jgi:peroxiredoxin (alkyl hydroperoxide reductase subunit C)
MTLSEQKGNMMSIRIGMPAPDMMTEGYLRGEMEPLPISLADFRGQWAVLVFYPRDFTFVCPTELQALARLQGAFAEAGAAVIAASTDSYYSHKAWFESDTRLGAATYPVLADTSHRLSEAFGVLQEDGTALRGTFVFDPAGTVRHAQINDLSVGRNMDETLRVVQALQTGELCPVSWRPGEPTLSSTAAGSAVAALVDERDEQAA